MRLAETRGLSLQECQATTTSSEFSLWIQYFYWKDTKQFDPLHHYLARIAYEVYRAARPKTKLTYEKFLLRFVSADKSKRVSNEAKQHQLLASKGFWLVGTGANRK